MSGNVASSLRADARWRPWEIALFAVLALSWWVLPGQALLLSEIAIVALFAVSLVLILGYAGIVSLGHAAFFGLGAYTAALVASPSRALAPIATARPTSGSGITFLANSAAVYEPKPKNAAWPSETMPA